MIGHSYPLWTGQHAKEIDRLSIEDLGLPAAVLMENAGRLCAEFADRKYGPDANYMILVGPGNNGGDGMVMARYLSGWGRQVTVILVARSQPAPFTELAASHWQVLRNLNIPTELYSFGKLAPMIKSNANSVVVDALVGLGISEKPMSGPVADVLSEASSLGTEVVAIDIPSGLNPNRGDQDNVLLPAHVTMTFGRPKIAHKVAPARTLCGEIAVFDIGFPALAEEKVLASDKPWMVEADSSSWLEVNPFRSLPRDGNKYDRGHVLVIGGSKGKTGAVALAAKAALRTGCGWASVALPNPCQDEWRSKSEGDPELVNLTSEFFWQQEKIDASLLEGFLAKRKVRSIVIGCGTIDSPITECVATVLSDFASQGGFVVIDAGACSDMLPKFNGVSKGPNHNQMMATPHPGEWQKLGVSLPAPLNKDSFDKVQEVVKNVGITLVYKGATPIVACERATLLTSGDKTLARAGSGDVYAGIVAAHGACGWNAEMAAIRSYHLLTKTSQLASLRVGPNSVLATDLIDQIGIAG